MFMAITQSTLPRLHRRDAATVPDTAGNFGIGSAVGATPLIELVRVRAGLPAGVRVLGKAEWMNPGGSVKDRAALAMIERGEASGALHPGVALIDATSGNTGIAFAMLCAARGYRCTLVVPANASLERRQTLERLGARLVLSDPMEGGTDEAQRVVRHMVDEEPDRWFHPDQYNNDANWQAHYRSTGAEIWQQTGGALTHFIAGLGTTGTFVGTSRRLKDFDPRVQCVAVQPDGPFHGLEGMKHLPTARVPGIYDPTLADLHATVATEEAHDMTRRLAREEGLFVGVSAAAAIVTALRVANTIERGTIVAILPDGGARYMSERFWGDGLGLRS